MLHPELLILAPTHECDPAFTPWQVAGPGQDFPCTTDTPYNAWVEAFLDEGIWFDFDRDHRLPAALPDTLDGFLCVMIPFERRDEFASGPAAERLLAFQRQGGYVFRPPPGVEDPVRLRGWVLRVIATAGLTQRHLELLRRLQTEDDQRLIDWWRATLPRQAEVLMAQDAGWAWGDPVAYHLYWPAELLAETYGDPSLLDPVWECVRMGLDPARWPRPVSCGKRFALKYGELTGDRSVLERLQREVRRSPHQQGCGESRRHWMLDGVRLNMDLEAPADVDLAAPPPRVRDQAWVWCEVAGSMGDGLAYLSRVSGDPAYADAAILQVLTTHRWNFAPDIGLWYHVGRPTGPERRGAPWGRGNGWMLYGIRGLLEDLPAGHPARPELVGALRDGLEGLLRWQGPYGLWHNVLNADERTSRQDSCTAWMFVNVYARAYRKGWLRDERIPEMCERAWRGLKTKLWRGLPIAHCSGTPYMFSRQAYLSWPHSKFLGTAPLQAILEIQAMRAARR